MCGRTAISRKVGYYAEQFNVHEVSEEAQNFKPSQNISCGTNLPILVANGDKRAFKLFHWGISFDHDGKTTTTINSRSETIKEIFPKSLYHKRCVLVCDGYYEWKKISEKLREPYFFYHENSPMLMAAIYDESKTNKAKCFSVLTVNAGNNVSFIHGRQPFLLTNETINKWLYGSSEEIDELLSVGISENNDMIECVKFHPVHEKMNSTHYQGDDCMKMKKSSAIPICNFFKTSPKKETINSPSVPTTNQNEEKGVLTHYNIQYKNDNSNGAPQDEFYPLMDSECIEDSATTTKAEIEGIFNSAANAKLSQCDHVVDFIDDLNLYYCKVCDVYSDRNNERAQASDKSTPVKGTKSTTSASNSTPVKATKKKSPVSSNSSTPAKNTKKRRIENSPLTASKITSFFTKKETV